jgi:hypothetical protein
MQQYESEPRPRGSTCAFKTAIAAGALLLSTGVAASSRETYIACDLMGPKSQHFAYSFTFDHAKGTLFWVEGNRELKIERHTSAELLVSHRGQFADVPGANAAFFDLGLSSGAAAVTYLQEPTEAEIAKCEKQQSSGCKDPVALPEYDEAGSCTFTERGSD